MLKYLKTLYNQILQWFQPIKVDKMLIIYGCEPKYFPSNTYFLCLILKTTSS
jgi:hypothetical protein